MPFARKLVVVRTRLPLALSLFAEEYWGAKTIPISAFSFVCVFAWAPQRFLLPPHPLNQSLRPHLFCDDELLLPLLRHCRRPPHAHSDTKRTRKATGEELVFSPWDHSSHLAPWKYRDFSKLRDYPWDHLCYDSTRPRADLSHSNTVDRLSNGRHHPKRRAR